MALISATDLTQLTQPLTSKNVILEEKRHIKEDRAKLDKLPAHYVGFTRYKLYRGKYTAKPCFREAGSV